MQRHPASATDAFLRSRDGVEVLSLALRRVAGVNPHVGGVALRIAARSAHVTLEIGDLELALARLEEFLRGLETWLALPMGVQGQTPLDVRLGLFERTYGRLIEIRVHEATCANPTGRQRLRLEYEVDSTRGSVAFATDVARVGDFAAALRSFVRSAA